MPASELVERTPKVPNPMANWPWIVSVNKTPDWQLPEQWEKHVLEMYKAVLHTPYAAYIPAECLTRMRDILLANGSAVLESAPSGRVHGQPDAEVKTSQPVIGL
jgi:hypothetical protein